MLAPPAPREAFGDYKFLDDGSTVWAAPSKSEIVERFEALKSAMNDAHATGFSPMEILMRKEGMTPAHSNTVSVDAIAEIEKGVSPDVLASIAPQLEKLKGVEADLAKDWLSNSPLSSGLVAYDLQAPAKYLVPRDTPLVNRTPRTTQGVGTTGRFKQITGVTNSQTGGVADITPFFNSESVGTTFGGVTGLRRPPKISYAAADQAILFMEQGLSDSVSMKAFYQSQGYENLRQLSQTALLWATKVGEEKSLLFGRGSATGFTGALAAPTGVTIGAAANPSGTQVGNSANIANLFVYVTAKSGRGESVASTVASSTALSATTGKVLPVSWTDSPGALGYNVYLGTVTGIANAFFDGSTATNSFTTTFSGGGTGGVPNAGAQPPASDTSADANAYDGFLTVLGNPNVAGYVSRLNASLSTVNPGTEFQAAFSALYNNGGPAGGQALLARPNIVWIYANGRVALSDALKTNPTGVGYRLVINNADANTGVKLGSIVNGLVNEVTGDMVDLEVHPYMPKGCAIVHSETLPIPNSEVSSTVEVRNVVDYTAIEWSPIQMSWDQSTYMLGSPLFYAPVFSGAVLGIAN